MTNIKATIFYTMDRSHPDMKYMENKSTKMQYTFIDTYIFPDTEKRSVWYGASMERMKDYIKSDLRLVAGGGYDSKHIHHVTFDFEVVSRTI